MKEDDVIVGITLGTLGAIGAAALTTPIPPPSPPHQPATVMTKPLIPITWAYPNYTVTRANKNSLFVKPMGLEFAIEGHQFLGLIDTGMTGNAKVMLNRETAEMVGIQNFHKSKKTEHVNFVESGKSEYPIYEDVPITIPGVLGSTVAVDTTVGGNNLVNPAVFLPKQDISFWFDSRRGRERNFVTFLPKKLYSPPLGASIPYIKGNETLFNWGIGHHILPAQLDTGGDRSLISPKIAHNIGLLHYEKTAHYDKVEDDFQYAYRVPVHLLGTPVLFDSEIYIEPGLHHNIVSGPELLEAGWGFRLSDKYVSFFKA